MHSTSLIKNHWAIILCGGRGSRLGSVSESLPKSLIMIHDKPLLWYTVLILYKNGFRKFIFPLGYKGEMIESFITKEFGERDFEIRLVDTGLETPIANRLHKVSKLIPEEDDFFLLNGDTFFDFNISEMYQIHKRKHALLTLSSVEIISPYGILVEEDGVITDFTRNEKISHFSLNDKQDKRGYVNSGFSWINKDALNLVDLEACENFEQELYLKVIKMGKACHYKIDGNWFAIDTQKDLNFINLKEGSKREVGEQAQQAKKNLTTRYSYQTRYYSDVNKLKESILNKTIIPHQVEIQPGPLGGEICWLKCPYCYGLSSEDNGERLSPERYVEILRQIAEGGVKKAIYAGYATDPLFYEHIEDLVQVSLDYYQIAGFHTKAITVSDRLVGQLTNPSIVPLSYFSISVDAGTNEVYNKVHGIPNSKAKLYDGVCKNISRISQARANTGAPLDISATYLINPLNHEKEEILKAIHDLRNAGVDLIRFTFPQVPRGYTVQNDEQNIPDRDKVKEYMKNLRPVIEAESTSQCEVIILDLDSMHEIQEPRTLPCFARYIFPCIGFDGWLSHCSESAAPHFRALALGDLNKRDFWDVFYDYDADNFGNQMDKSCQQMNTLGCKCDRKEHVVNSRIKDSGIFNGII